MPLSRFKHTKKPHFWKLRETFGVVPYRSRTLMRCDVTQLFAAHKKPHFQKIKAIFRVEHHVRRNFKRCDNTRTFSAYKDRKCGLSEDKMTFSVAPHV